MSDHASHYTDEEKLAKVELVRQKTGVSYADARSALELCDYDALDAVVLLESQGKTAPSSATFTTADTPSADAQAAEQMTLAQIEYERSTKRNRFEENFGSLMDWIKRILRKSIDISVVASQDGSRRLAIPLLVAILLLVFAFPFTFAALVVSLFFDFRYHFEGVSTVTVDLNDLSQKASDAAGRIKREVREHEERDQQESGPFVK